MVVALPKKTYVFFDERYPYSWIPHNVGKIIAEKLSGYDFEVIDANGLKKIVEEGSRTTTAEYVIVFAQDIVPDTVLDNPTNPSIYSPLRKFLNVGHTIVWIGDVPLYYVGTPGNKLDTPKAMQTVLNLNPEFKNTNRMVGLTATGIIFGLTEWIGRRPHNNTPPITGTVHYVPLARMTNNSQYLHAFIIHYKQSMPLSGFIRIYDCPINHIEMITDSFIRSLVGAALRSIHNVLWRKMSLLNKKIQKLSENIDTLYNTLKSEIDSLKSALEDIIKMEKEILNTMQKKPIEC